MNFRGIGIDGTDVRQQPDGAELPLTRQPSIYSLTFDEFQSTMSGIGKDFGSMNMDEFLKNIWTAEESHVMAASLAPPNGGTSCAHPELQRQGSLTLPRTLSQKTVDEVWRDLSRESAGGVGGSEFQQQQQQQQQRQPTLGEMTLEEFLVRAGVVREDISIPGPPGISIDNSTNISNGAFYGNSSSITSGHSNNGLSLGFSQAVGCSNIAMSSTGTRPFATQLPMASNVNFGNSQGLRGGEIIGIGDPIINNGMTSEMVSLGGGGNIVTSVSPANQVLSDGLSKGNGDLSSLSPVPYVFNGSLRGRKCNGTVEKVVERRQRRMIKNRESAARSRARKQAYTMELEAEVAKLKEQNQELQKKQAVIMEMQKNQQALLEASNQQREAKQPCLRRTATGPW